MAAERVTGYPVDRFTNPTLISEEFICSICQDVLREPQMITPCEHIFCRSCIEQWNRQEGDGGTCPIDRNMVLLLQNPIRPFLNMLNALEMWCGFRAQGCTTVVKLGDLVQHEGRCQFSPHRRSECPSACGAELTQAERGGHNCIAFLKQRLLAAGNRADEAHDRTQEAQDQLQEKDEEIRRLRRELEEARRQIQDLQQPSTSAAARASLYGPQMARRGGGRSGPCPARFKPYAGRLATAGARGVEQLNQRLADRRKQLIAEYIQRQKLSQLMRGTVGCWASEAAAATPPPPAAAAAAESAPGSSSSSQIRISTRLQLDIAPGITVREIRGTTNRENLTQHLQTAIATVARALAPGHRLLARTTLHQLEEYIEDELERQIGTSGGLLHVGIGLREGEGSGDGPRANTGIRHTLRDYRRFGFGTVIDELGRFELHVRDLEILIILAKQTGGIRWS